LAAREVSCSAEENFPSLGPISFEGSSYVFVNKKCDAISAENYCAREGGHLIRITNQGKQNFIEETINSNYQCERGSVIDCAFWVGLRRKGDTFVWKYPDVTGYPQTSGEKRCM